MDGRCRFHRVMRFEPVDRPPYWDLQGAEPATIARWQEEGLPADEYADAYFDLDRVGRMPIDDGLLPAFPEEVRGFKDGVVTRRDALGRVCRERDGAVLEVVSYPLVTRADLAAVQRRLDPRSPRRYPQQWAEYQRCVKEHDYPLGIDVRGPLGRLIDLAGPTWVAALVDEDPALVHESLETFARFLVDLTRPALAAVSDLDFIILREALWGEALTAKEFATWLAPCYGALLQTVADYGVDTVIVACEGDLNEAVGPLTEAGVTALAPLSVAAGMDPVALRQAHPQGPAFIGGIDTRVLAQDHEAIEQEVTEKVPVLTNAGGWIPGLDRAVPPDVPLDNYRYYWELVRDVIEG